MNTIITADKILKKDQVLTVEGVKFSNGEVEGRSIKTDGERLDANSDGPNAAKTARASYQFGVNSFTLGFHDESLDGGNYLYIPNHGLKVHDTIRITTTTVLPAGLAKDTTYYVISANNDYFQLSLTRGGDSIEFTDLSGGSGSGSASSSSSSAEFMPHTMKVNVFGKISFGYTLPENALVKEGFLDVREVFSSSGELSVVFGLETSNDIQTTTSLNVVGIAGISGSWVRLTAERHLIMEVTGAEITAGKFVIFLDYVVSL